MDHPTIMVVKEESAPLSMAAAESAPHSAGGGVVSSQPVLRTDIPSHGATDHSSHNVSPGSNSPNGAQPRIHRDDADGDGPILDASPSIPMDAKLSALLLTMERAKSKLPLSVQSDMTVLTEQFKQQRIPLETFKSRLALLLNTARQLARPTPFHHSPNGDFNLAKGHPPSSKMLAASDGACRVVGPSSSPADAFHARQPPQPHGKQAKMPAQSLDHHSGHALSPTEPNHRRTKRSSTTRAATPNKRARPLDTTDGSSTNGDATAGDSCDATAGGGSGGADGGASSFEETECTEEADEDELEALVTLSLTQASLKARHALGNDGDGDAGTPASKRRRSRTATTTSSSSSSCTASDGAQSTPRKASRRKRGAKSAARTRSQADKWTEEESARLVSFIRSEASQRGYSSDRVTNARQFPHGFWKRAATAVGGTKTDRKCRQRYIRVIMRSLSEWTYEEEVRLVDLVHSTNGKWSDVARGLCTRRPDTDCRYHYLKIKGQLDAVWDEKMTDALEQIVARLRKQSPEGAIDWNVIASMANAAELNTCPYVCRVKAIGVPDGKEVPPSVPRRCATCGSTSSSRWHDVPAQGGPQVLCIACFDGTKSARASKGGAIGGRAAVVMSGDEKKSASTSTPRSTANKRRRIPSNGTGARRRSPSPDQEGALSGMFALTALACKGLGMMGD